MIEMTGNERKWKEMGRGNWVKGRKWEKWQEMEREILGNGGE